MPEISHRCPACGASTRDFGEGVLFCPECGQPLAGSEKAEASEPGQPAANEPVVAAAASTGAKRTGDLPTEKITNPEHGDRASARERTRETLQRASQMTKGAIEHNVKRVEKMHHVSSVMLEEATYDPSLRFVLVALGLFVLFVVLLVLSKVMG